MQNKLTVVTGTELMKQIASGRLDPFPKYQRMAPPSKSLSSSMEKDARAGFLAFLFPVRKKEIGDGLRRIQVLQSWMEDDDTAALLGSVRIVLSNYDHLTRREFVDLYIRMNDSAKQHTAGDFVKAYQHLLDKDVLGFVNRDEFQPGGDWIAYTKSNSQWFYSVIVQYGLPYNSRRDTILEALSGREKIGNGAVLHVMRSSTDTVKHLERVFTLLTELRTRKAKSTTSKWAVALMSDAIEREPRILKLHAGIVCTAWNTYVATYLERFAGNREVGDSKKTDYFLSLVLKPMQIPSVESHPLAIALSSLTQASAELV